MNHQRFSVYFYLTGNQLCLLEIKRQDLGEEQDPGKLYHWLKYDPTTNLLHRLEFRSMRSQPPEQEREFVQGSLKFNQQSGTFVETPSGTQHELQVQPNDQTPENLLRWVDNYLDQINP